MAKKKRKKKCKYYVNTNFFVDLERGDTMAAMFALKHRGRLCTSTLLVLEYRAARKGYLAKRLARLYDIGIVKIARRRYVQQALGIVGDRASPNTILDTAHILVAKKLGAVFVTADRAACKRAAKVGVDCILYRGDSSALQGSS